MTTILRVTETTGPTKRIQELPVCVSEHAYISTPFWLKTGFDLFKREANFSRDYMLPKLNIEMTAFRKTMANYNDVSSYSALIRRKAMRPGTDIPLIPPELSSFWTEHSERSTLSTGLALQRVSRDERDMIGRWRPEGSDTYIRMYNGGIARLQLQYAKIARQQDRTVMLDERDVIESATSSLADRLDPMSDEDMRVLLDNLDKSLQWGVQPGWELAEEPDVPTQEDTADGADNVPHAMPVAHPAVAKETRQPLYVVVNNGTRCKRLQKSKGGCWMGREMSFKSSVEYYECPDPSSYTHFCKVCWQKGQITADEGDSSDSSSTSSSNSASGSEPSSEAE